MLALLKNKLLQFRRRRASRLDWERRHAKVFARHPELRAARPKATEQAHLDLWRPLRPDLSLATYRICANLSGTDDPRYVPEELFVSELQEFLYPNPHVRFLADKNVYDRWFGDAGPPALTGAAGPPALTGAAGPPALTGAAGPPALTGAAGPPALTGAAGPPALTGAAGPPALTGAAGPPALTPGARSMERGAGSDGVSEYRGNGVPEQPSTKHHARGHDPQAPSTTHPASSAAAGYAVASQAPSAERGEARTLNAPRPSPLAPPPSDLRPRISDLRPPTSDLGPPRPLPPASTSELRAPSSTLPAPQVFPRTFLRQIDGRLYDVNYQVIDPVSLPDRLASLPYPVVCKPAVGSFGGRNIAFCRTAAELTATLAKLPQAVVQERLLAHPFLAQFGGSGLNTLRVYLYRSPITGDLHLLNAALRMGVGGSLDNETAGGIVCSVDANGSLNHYALDKYAGRYSAHPDSGIAFGGLAIPAFPAMIRLAHQLAAHILGARLIGLDLCLDQDNHWRCIEINLGMQTIRFAQYAGQPFFGQFTEEVIAAVMAGR